MKAVVDALDWRTIAEQLDQEGHALIPGLFDADQSRELAALAELGGRVPTLAPGLGADRNEPAAVERRLDLTAAKLGSGELVYLAQSLAEPLASLRAALYRRLVPIAEVWNAALGRASHYPDKSGLASHSPEGLDLFSHQPEKLDALLAQDRRTGRPHWQCALSRLPEGGHQILHQHAESEAAFPLQLVALCSEPGRDFTGGEFVMTEQRPRMQSRPIVLPLRQGDAAIIAVAHRPCRAARGVYRSNLKHAVSRVRSGTRVGLELLLGDGP